HLLLSVLAVRFGDQFPIRADKLNALRDYLNRNTTYDDLLLTSSFALFPFAVSISIGIRRYWVVVIIWLPNYDWLSIKIRVTEQRSRLFEIHDGEKELVVFLQDASAATNDLLERRHRVDGLVEDDQLAGSRIYTGGQQLRGGCDNRKPAFGVDEVV